MPIDITTKHESSRIFEKFVLNRFKQLEKRGCKGLRPLTGVWGCVPAFSLSFTGRRRRPVKDRKNVFRGHPEPRQGCRPAPAWILELLCERFGMSHDKTHWQS